MKLIISICIIISIVGCKTDRNTEIFLKKTDNNADTALAGESKKIFYTIRNIGNINLVIKDIVFSCECTSADIKKGTEIPSGSERKVEFIMNTRLSEKGKTKSLLCTFTGNTKPQISSIKIPVYIK
ncbi:MAG: hypothetical protein RIR12_2352 [Bacteroidota bacterium]|jgi:hypothetical protein